MATRKKPSRGKNKRTRKAKGGGLASAMPPMPEQDNVTVTIADELGEVPFDPANGALEFDNGDGTITIELAEPEVEERDEKFDDNLAEDLDEFTLGRIASTLLEAIEQDDRDRSEWVQQRADGLELVGTRIEKPGGGNVGSSSTAVPGQSTVRDCILGEAVFRFQANSFAELCPSEGPCKVVNYGQETTVMDGLAESFEKDMNYYLTTTAKEYYPDTRKMLWWVGYAGGMFKKVYMCPLRNRPVSESVDGADLIVPSSATDLHNAQRITHQINMPQNTLKRMQILGVYRDVPLTSPTPTPNALQNKEAAIVGMNPNQVRPEDQDYTIYECYCDLDLPGYEHKKGKKPTGLAVPYRVTLDKDTKVILEIRRNWDPPSKDEQDKLPVKKVPFVLFPYATGLGFYGTGLLHQLGNYAMALTSMLRESIDAGMFASFPGFLFAKPLGRQLQNEFRVPPGGGAPIDVSATGNDINKAVMPLPYKDVSTAFVGLMQQTRDAASRYGAAADTPTGEGVQNAPVGSVLAAIDQATRIEGGVHKALYAAQREELGLIVELLRKDPEALWRDNKRPSMGSDPAQRMQRFKLALETCDLQPASDPNVPSHMHRIAKAMALVQTLQTVPGGLKPTETLTKWGQMMRIDDIEQLVAPPAPPQQDPLAQGMIEAKKGELALKAQDLQIKQAALAAKAQNDAANRESKENIEAMKAAAQHAAGQNTDPQTDPLREQELALKHRGLDLQENKQSIDAQNADKDRDNKLSVEALKIAATVGVHPEAEEVVDQQLAEMAPFLTPKSGGGKSEGGPVEAGEDETTERVRWALNLARTLNTEPQPPRWWN